MGKRTNVLSQTCAEGKNREILISRKFPVLHYISYLPPLSPPVLQLIIVPCYEFALDLPCPPCQLFGHYDMFIFDARHNLGG